MTSDPNNNEKTEESATNKPDDTLIAEYEWMIRPCQLYYEEYSDCTSIKARFHQYFVYGKMIDCSQWKRDYDNCEKWTDKKDEKAAKEIINSEMARRKARLQAHYANDVWTTRTKPPENWNSPLPDHIAKNYPNSYLDIKARQMRGEKIPNVPFEERTTCTIM